jgi:hypothetical protein
MTVESGERLEMTVDDGGGGGRLEVDGGGGGGDGGGERIFGEEDVKKHTGVCVFFF